MWRPLLLVALVVATALAGCTSRSEPQAVDFAGRNPTQAGASGRSAFHLHVRVMGVEPGPDNETHPIPGAFVGAASAGQALAKAYANEDGEATLVVKTDQALRLVAQAEGWTTEDSAELLLGDARGSSEGTACVPAPVPCIVVIDSDGRQYRMTGREGHVGLVLFRSRVVQEFDIPVSPRGNLILSHAPDPQGWLRRSEKLAGDENLHRLHMLRLRTVEAHLEWTNQLLEQGDFEVALGCRADAYDARSSGGYGQSYMATQGRVQVDFKWEPPADGGWSPCKDVHGGPWVNTFNTAVETHLTLESHFVGHSSIVPINA